MSNPRCLADCTALLLGACHVSSQSKRLNPSHRPSASGLKVALVGASVSMPTINVCAQSETSVLVSGAVRGMDGPTKHDAT